MSAQIIPFPGNTTKNHWHGYFAPVLQFPPDRIVRRIVNGQPVIKPLDRMYDHLLGGERHPMIKSMDDIYGPTDIYHDSVPNHLRD